MKNLLNLFRLRLRVELTVEPIPRPLVKGRSGEFPVFDAAGEPVEDSRQLKAGAA